MSETAFTKTSGHGAARKPKAYSYVRFSTPEQQKGSSLERQLKLSREYAATHQLDLDEKLTFRDLGVSGFKGGNLERGAFRLFLDAVELGKIGSGDYLLVESLDRISRAEVTRQMGVFMDILNAGITIVTLNDGRTYSKATVNENSMDLVVSMLVMVRGHEESATKSKRIKHAWKIKLKNGKKLTSRCPAWLRLDKGANRFEIIEERRAVLRRIFAMVIAGMGRDTIAATLNREKVPVFGKGVCWHDSYVQKVVFNRAVLGEFQPHEMDANRKRVPVGEPIPDYFPRVIDDDTFLRAHSIRKVNAGFVGRTGQRLGNLFTGLAFCGYSGASMILENKGEPDGRAKYLLASDSKQGRGARRITWPYQQFETSFLTFITELDTAELLSAGETNHIHSLEHSIAVEQQRVASIKQKLERYSDVMLGMNAPLKTIAEKMTTLEQQENASVQRIQELETKLQIEMETRDAFRADSEQIKALFARRDEADFRFRIRTELRKRVARIEVYAGGCARTEQIFDTVEQRKKGKAPVKIDGNEFASLYAPKKGGEVILRDNVPAKWFRFFKVFFTNGAVKIVAPCLDNPTEFRRITCWQSDKLNFPCPFEPSENGEKVGVFVA